MSKPKHFKKVEYPKSCNDCLQKKTSYTKGLKCICRKHDFIFDNASSRHLEQYACDDIDVYKDEVEDEE